MPEFVFTFGHESASERQSNETYGTDFESSQAVIIEAPSEQAAVEWGCEIAEQFVHKAFGVSWREGRYARWAEPSAECLQAAGFDRVQVGQMPDIQAWL